VITAKVADLLGVPGIRNVFDDLADRPLSAPVSIPLARAERLEAHTVNTPQTHQTLPRFSEISF
jgi:hypothetical protein